MKGRILHPIPFFRELLDFSDRDRHAPYYALHKDLIRLRHDDGVFRAQARGGLDGAVLSGEAFVLRYFGENDDDRLLLVNFGMDLNLDPAPEPLLAPPEGRQWVLLWSSEDPRYAGSGTFPPETNEGWHLPGHAALVMRPAPFDENPNP